MHGAGMRFSRLHNVLAVATFAVYGCGQGGSDGVRDLAQEMGWDGLAVKVVDVGYLAEPGLFDGICVIGIQPPDAVELSGTIWPDQAPVFRHIGESVDQCLTGAAASVFSLPSYSQVYLDQYIHIDFDADEEDCGAQIVGGCYLAWADLAVILPERLSELVSKEVSYDALEAVVVGHEIWHMVAGDFHP